jgi:hypothetical protein
LCSLIAYIRRTQKKPLQTGFLYGMERLLDVKQDLRDVRESADVEDHPRYQVEEADAEDQEDGAERDLARQRYQRFFFESIVEGQVIIFFFIRSDRASIICAGANHALRSAKSQKQRRCSYCETSSGQICGPYDATLP